MKRMEDFQWLVFYETNLIHMTQPTRDPVPLRAIQLSQRLSSPCLVGYSPCQGCTTLQQRGGILTFRRPFVSQSLTATLDYFPGNRPFFLYSVTCESDTAGQMT